jgi:hypothetical protein
LAHRSGEDSETLLIASSAATLCLFQVFAKQTRGCNMESSNTNGLCKPVIVSLEVSKRLREPICPWGNICRLRRS